MNPDHKQHDKDERKEDVRSVKRKLEAIAIDTRKHEREIVSYFERRLERMKIVRTTETPLGQTIDWVPIESQLKAGQRIAEPPPGSLETTASYRERPAKFVRFELEDKNIARGPEGTVPVLRKNLKGIRFSQTLAKLLGKYSTSRVRFPINGGYDTSAAWMDRIATRVLARMSSASAVKAYSAPSIRTAKIPTTSH